MDQVDFKADNIAVLIDDSMAAMHSSRRIHRNSLLYFHWKKAGASTVATVLVKSVFSLWFLCVRQMIA
jgi:hypothetical protein